MFIAAPESVTLLSFSSPLKTTHTLKLLKYTKILIELFSIVSQHLRSEVLLLVPTCLHFTLQNSHHFCCYSEYKIYKTPNSFTNNMCKLWSISTTLYFRVTWSSVYKSIYRMLWRQMVPQKSIYWSSRGLW